MTKKTALIILSALVIVAILVIGFFLLFTNKAVQNNGAVESARNLFTSFFPTSQPATSSPQNNFGPEPTVNPTTNLAVPKLRQISAFPVAGAGMFERAATTSSLLVQGTSTAETNIKVKEVVYRFVERATGNIFETTSRNLSQSRITNTTIPKVYDSIFSGDTNSLAMIYLNNNARETFIGKINYPVAATTTKTATTILAATTTKSATSSPENNSDENFASVTGTFLPVGSASFTKSVTSDDFAFLKTTFDQSGTQNTTIYKGSFKTPSKYAGIYTLLTSEWGLQVLKDGTVAMTTKPSLLSQGFLYFLNPKDGILRKKLGNTLGLTTLVSPDGKRILYSYYDSGDTKTVVYNADKKLYTPLNISTFPIDKCAWSKSQVAIVYCAVPANLTRGNFPDSWYQGSYSFNDNIVKVDTDIFDISIITLANRDTEGNLDVINPTLSPSDDYFTFMNKNDLTLWSLDLR